MNILSMPHNRKRHPDRVGKLATLPVFFKLSGRPILLAGGSEAAAWKAELLAATGAIVHIYSIDICRQFQELTLTNPSQYIVHRENWESAQFKDFALIIGDMESLDEAQKFHDRATASGVPVNVIDKPQFCQFQFGSIVNRSPTIVAISTDGAAPILGQAIRRKIEAVLPMQLSSWTKLAQRVRGQVADTLQHGADRRKFWERFVDRAFHFRKKAPNECTVLSDLGAIENGQDFIRGQISLVGAGHGDAEHLTLAAMRSLQSADFIFSAETISNDVLSLARREAEHICIGVAGIGTDQAHKLMSKLALQGKNVVHLTLGNPYECSQALAFKNWIEYHGIEIHMVPGISFSRQSEANNIPASQVESASPRQQLRVTS